MAASFEWHRSTYDVRMDTPYDSENPNYAIREVVTSIGSNGGNFFNFNNGSPNTNDDVSGYPYNERGSIGDIVDPMAFPEYPLRTSGASVEVWLRGYWSGDFGAISNIHFICTLLNMEGYGQGAWINGRVADQYPTGDADLVGGVNNMGQAGPHIYLPSTGTLDLTAPMSQSSDPNVGYLDLTPGYDTSDYSRYAVLQLCLGANTWPGEGGRSSFAIYYDES